MAGKLYIKTHGCQMNEYDSAKMADVLGAAHGLTLTENEAEADVILINTCSIREKAQEKVFSQLGRWRAAPRSVRAADAASAARTRGRRRVRA
jgi:tRNA-2-methylthio-N6-dimethylallyladenosine synthase